MKCLQGNQVLGTAPVSGRLHRPQNPSPWRVVGHQKVWVVESRVLEPGMTRSGLVLPEAVRLKKGIVLAMGCISLVAVGTQVWGWHWFTPGPGKGRALNAFTFNSLSRA